MRMLQVPKGNIPLLESNDGLSMCPPFFQFSYRSETRASCIEGVKEKIKESFQINDEDSSVVLVREFSIQKMQGTEEFACFMQAACCVSGFAVRSVEKYEKFTWGQSCSIQISWDFGVELELIADFILAFKEGVEKLGGSLDLSGLANTDVGGAYLLKSHAEGENAPSIQTMQASGVTPTQNSK